MEDKYSFEKHTFVLPQGTPDIIQNNQYIFKNIALFECTSWKFKKFKNLIKIFIIKWKKHEEGVRTMRNQPLYTYGHHYHHWNQKLWYNKYICGPEMSVIAEFGTPPIRIRVL